MNGSLRVDAGFARGLRTAATEAEAALWSRLRNRAVGVKFRRQAPMGVYVLDFWCAEVSLVVEVDGFDHLSPEGQAHDARRTAWLESRGARVLRFLNTEVLRETDAVVQRIVDVVAELRASR